MGKTTKQKEGRELAKVRNMRFIREYKEYHACSVCDEGRTACLDLHHKDPTTKEFELSEGYKRSIKAIKAELAKCIVVCANCHRVIHAEQEFERKASEMEQEKTLFSGI